MWSLQLDLDRSETARIYQIQLSEMLNLPHREDFRFDKVDFDLLSRIPRSPSLSDTARRRRTTRASASSKPGLFSQRRQDNHRRRKLRARRTTNLALPIRRRR